MTCITATVVLSMTVENDVDLALAKSLIEEQLDRSGDLAYQVIEVDTEVVE